MTRFLAIVTAVAMMAVSPVRADVQLSFSPDGSATTFTVDVGQTVAVPVYVLQTGVTNILTTDGLFSGGVHLNFTNSIPGGAEITAAAHNPGFSLATPSFPAISNSPAGGFGATSANVFLQPRLFPSGGNPNSVQVGTFTFQGNIAGTVVNLATSNPNATNFSEFVAGAAPNQIVLEQAPFGQIFWPNGVVPGGTQPANSATVVYSSSITVVPEPTTILGMCAAFGGVIAWRQKRKARKDAAEVGNA